jgi:aspartate/methionine/tyrosine aminotransferase
MTTSAVKSRVMNSEYMKWAKTRAHGKYNLAVSGVAPYPLSELPVKIEDLEINGESAYGYEPLQKALAAKCGVETKCVVAAVGTSLANFLVMAATIEAGDEVLIEQPAYDPLLSVAGYLRAEIRRFQRDAANGFQIDLRDLERSITSRTRLIVLTNLHNPSNAYTDEETLRQIGEIARSLGARVLVDEVYLDAMFERAPRSSFHLGREFVVTTSLTKAYGLSGLRCGWILAEPDLAKKLWGLIDLTIGIPAHPAELLSCIALANLEQIAARARALLETNRALLDRFLDQRDDLATYRPGVGTVVFPRLKSGGVDALCDLLREKYETSIVPGRFFEMPDHFRLGYAGAPEMFAEGIQRLDKVLDELAAH